MSIKWGKIAQFGGYGVIGMLLLSIRATNLSEPEPAPVAMAASLSGDTATYSSQQLEAGQNILSNQVLTRATYLLERAQKEPNAIKWLEGHRGRVLGQLRAADTQRGGIWRGTAEDNAMTPVIVESLAIELARTWLTTKEATLMDNHTLANYLASARMAGSNGRYDPATMELYLSAMGVVGKNILRSTPPVQPSEPTETVESEAIPAENQEVGYEQQ